MSRNKKLKYAYIYFIFNTPKIEFIIIDFKNEGTNKNLIAAWTIMYYKLQTHITRLPIGRGCFDVI